MAIPAVTQARGWWVSQVDTQLDNLGNVASHNCGPSSSPSSSMGLTDQWNVKNTLPVDTPHHRKRVLLMKLMPESRSPRMRGVSSCERDPSVVITVEPNTAQCRPQRIRSRAHNGTDMCVCVVLDTASLSLRTLSDRIYETFLQILCILQYQRKDDR